MENNLNMVLAQIELKIRKLRESKEAFEKEKAEVFLELEKERKDRGRIEKELKESKELVESLKVANSILKEGDNGKEVRLMIRDIVKKIDNCITKIRDGKGIGQ